MLSPETVSETDVRALLTAQSMQRARSYVDRVGDSVRFGRNLSAQVRGTRVYRVDVVVGPDRIVGECTCPYDWSGYCKHIGAVLLAWLESPESFACPGKGVPDYDYAREVVPAEPPATEPWAEPPFWLTTTVHDIQAADRDRLLERLLEVKLVDLRQMVRGRGWRVKGTKKAEIADHISRFMVDAPEIARTVGSLSTGERTFLSAMLLLGAGSRTRKQDLERVLEAWTGSRGDQPTDGYARRLWQLGLMLPSYAGERGVGRGAIPRAIARHLPPLLSSLAIDLPQQADSSCLFLADPYEMVRSAIQLTLLLEKNPVALRAPMPRPALEKHYPQLERWDYDLDEIVRAERNGGLARQQELILTVPPPQPSLTDETLERLAPTAGSRTQLEFVYSVLVAASVLQPGSPTTVSQTAKSEFLHRGENSQRSVLTRVFVHMMNWSTLWEVLREQEILQLKRNARYGYYAPEHLGADLRLIRHLVLRAASMLPDNAWVSVQAFCGFLRAAWPLFDQPTWDPFRFGYMLPTRRSRGPWFLTRDGQPLRDDSATDWELAQGSYIRQLIRGPLHWLGLADLYYDGGELAAFRLHGLADLYWDRQEAQDEGSVGVSALRRAPSAEAVTTRDLAISVDPAAISPAAHSLLDEVARLDSAETDRFIYRVDPQAAYEAFESGVTLTGILEGWQRQMPIPMPEAIRESLAGWWQAYGRVRIYENLTVVEFGDDYALAEMKAVSSLESHLIAEVGSRLAIIRRDSAKTLVAELVRAGYTPKVVERQIDG